jgi:hypothetical protein
MKQTILKAMSAVAVLVTVTFGAGISDVGLVAWYPFTGSGNYADGSGNGNNLYWNISGAVPASVSDRFGTANAADSFYNDYLVGDAMSLPSGDSDRTVSLWVRPLALTGNQCLFYYGDTVSGKYLKIEVTDEGISNRLHVSNGLSELSVLCVPFASTTRPSLAEESWNHVAVTITKNETKIYTNNRLDTTGVITGWNTTKDSLVIGARKRTSSNDNVRTNSNFLGGIDDISVYRVALSSTQITQLYNASSTIETTTITHGKTTIQRTPWSNVNNSRLYDARGRVITGRSFGIQVQGAILTIPR